MYNLPNKQCPLLKKKCSGSGCAMWDDKLTNCLIRLTPHNLFKLEKTVERAIAVLQEIISNRSNE